MRHLFTILIVLCTITSAAAQVTDIRIFPKEEQPPDPHADFVFSVRGAKWYDTPGQIAAVEKDLQHSEVDTDGILSITYQDQFHRARTDLVVVYSFARTSNDKAPELVRVSLSLSPVSYYTFLAVSEQLQNRYSITYLDLDDSSDDTAGVLYNVYKNDTTHFLQQNWAIGDTSIDHTIFFKSPFGASHILEYQVSRLDEITAVAKELHDRNELAKKRAELETYADDF